MNTPIESTANPCATQLRDCLPHFEALEEYECCVNILDRIKAIETGDAQAYVRLMYDRSGLIESGFIAADATWKDLEVSLCHFFGLQSILDETYTEARLLTCCYRRLVAVHQFQCSQL